MRLVKLCRNFSRGALKSRAVQKERYEPASRIRSAEGERQEGWNEQATRVCDPEGSEVQASSTEFETQES
jgi:hypothetical protein